MCTWEMVWPSVLMSLLLAVCYSDKPNIIILLADDVSSIPISHCVDLD